MSSQSTAKETEADLIRRAQQALSQCNWDVGECASIWTKRFARGRTDADFAVLIGLSPDQVYQRRRVWETFADVRENYSALKWSHFYSALTWDDAAECLQWAQDIQATVAEMKAWRRAQRGEDLSQSAAEEPYSLLLGETVAVKAPSDSPAGEGSRSESSRGSSGQEVPTMAGVARQSEDGEYAPFRDGAAAPPPESEHQREREAPSPEQAIKRMSSALERCEAMLTTEVRRAFPKLPEKVRQRFLRAVRELEKKVGDLA
jgi:hypothetical protein